MWSKNFMINFDHINISWFFSDHKIFFDQNTIFYAEIKALAYACQ